MWELFRLGLSGNITQGFVAELAEDTREPPEVYLLSLPLLLFAGC